MAGKYPISDSTLLSIQRWLDRLALPNGWMASDLHIDEINGFTKVKRQDWIPSCLTLFPVVAKMAGDWHKDRIFLYCRLMDRPGSAALPEMIDLLWLSRELDMMTPPTFNICPSSHWEATYSALLQPIQVAHDMQIKGISLFVGLEMVHNLSSNSMQRGIYFCIQSCEIDQLQVVPVSPNNQMNLELIHRFQVLFPPDDLYDQKDDWTEVDLMVVLENGDLYSSTAFPMRYINAYFHRYNGGYFWAKDMLIVPNVRKKTIQLAVGTALRENYFDQIFSLKGRASDVLGPNFVFQPS